MLNLTQTKCPCCDVLIEIPAPIVYVVFPNDVQLLAELIEKKFNLRTCPACTEKFLYVAELVINDPTEKKAVFANSLPNAATLAAMQQKLGPEFSLIQVDDYEQIRAVIIEWLKGYLAGIYFTVVLAERSSRDVFIEKLTPLVFRILLLGVSRYLNIKVADADNPTKAVDIRELYPGIVFNYLFALFMNMADDKNVLSYPEKLSIIPVECFTDDVFSHMAEMGDQFFKKTNATAIELWPVGFINAAAHYHAGRPNPDQNFFAQITNSFWIRKRNEPDLKWDSPDVFLNPDLADKYLTFELMFTINARQILKDVQDNNIDKNHVGPMMEYYGWTKQYHITLASRIIVEPNMKDDELEPFFGTIIEKFPEKQLSGEGVGVSIAAIAGFFLKAKKNIQAQRICTLGISYAAARGNYTGCVAICVECIKRFNEYHEHVYSGFLMARLQNEFCTYIDQISAVLRFEYYIERGNTCRYSSDIETAFEYYGKAFDLLEDTSSPVYTDDKKLKEAYTVTTRNIAIVLRDMGQLTKSVELFNVLIYDNPDDFGIVNNLATFYAQQNDPEGAIRVLSPFLHKPGLLTPFEEISLEIGLLRAYIALGDQYQIVSYGEKIYGKWTRLNNHQQSLFIVSILDFSPQNIRNAGFRFDIEALAKENITAAQQQPINHAVAAMLLYYYLRENNLTAATDVFDQHFKGKRLKFALWIFTYIMAWYYFATGQFEVAADTIKELLHKLTDTIPTAENASYAFTWLRDKDDAQQHLISMAFTLMKGKYLRWQLLLALIDFRNGNEITAQLSALLDDDEHADRLRKKFALQYGFTLLCTFFEENGNIRLLIVSSAYDQCHISDPFATAVELRKIKNAAITAFRQAIPDTEMLTYTDRQLASFHRLMKVIGAQIDEFITSETRNVYIVAGEALSNLPLHLITLSDSRYLIERLPVAYINSISTLQLLQPKEQRKNVLMVNVSKEDDTPRYIDAALQCITQLREDFEQNNISVEHLSGLGATIGSVISQMEGVDEAIMICHGASGTKESGTGICLAHDRYLPPRLLPVDRLASLKDFLLTWRDFDETNHSPQIFVSTACSSGMVSFGKGGVQLALEQALFSRGTTTIITPQWNIDQESALFWLQAYYYAQFNHTGTEIDQCYRHACLETKKKYPHIYFWSPFILKGTFK